jgi:hypothetical protein
MIEARLIVRPGQPTLHSHSLRGFAASRERNCFDPHFNCHPQAARDCVAICFAIMNADGGLMNPRPCSLLMCCVFVLAFSLSSTGSNTSYLSVNAFPNFTFTNPFDSNGNFRFTNGLQRGAAREFYTLQLP